MKKFITLLLVLTGMVSTAMAGTYTVFFKPNTSSYSWKQGNERYALCFQGNAEGDLWVSMTETSSGSGIYQASYTTRENDNIMIICRMDGSKATNSWDNRWDQSGNFAVPTSYLYVDKSNNTWKESWKEDTENMVILTPSSKTFTINNDGCEADILPNFMDTPSSANNNLSSNDDFTYSCTVSGNVIRKGTYGFKISDGTNTYDDGGSAWPVSGISTSKDAKYNITYSFNFITGVASATATDTEESVSITTKYIIAGDEALTGYTWDWSGDTNVMTIDGGGTTASLTLSDVLIKGTYYYKAGKLLSNNGTVYKHFYESGDNNNYYFGDKRYYDITFSCDLSTLDASASASNSEGYFLYGGTSSWDWGQKMTESAGVYSTTLSNMPGYAFCIVNTNDPANLDGDHPTWAKLIRPSKTADERTYIDFANYNNLGTVIENSNRGWQIQGTGSSDYDNDADVTISYNPSTEKWSVACADMEVAIGAAGYATYSNHYAYQVSGATNLYTVSAAGTNSVTLTNHEASTKFYGGAAIIIKGTTQATIKALADGTATDAIGDNYLVGSGNSTKHIAAETGIYIFNWDGSNPSTVGFYTATSDGDLGAHKAYLDISALGGARDFLGFDFENTTDIKAVNSNNVVNGEYYNLAGQRVAQPTKGLYIVNGKKVIIK